MTRKQTDPYRLFKYVARGAGEGILAGWVLFLILKHLNIGHIGDLIANSESGGLITVMAFFFFGITFGMVGIAWRVMILLPDEED